jgi:hypothetical protein
MHNLITNINRIIELLKFSFENDLYDDENFKPYRHKPKATDIQIVAMSITQEIMGICAENDFYNRINAENAIYFKRLPHLSNYNRRRNKLMHYSSFIIDIIKAQLSPKSDIYLIDSINIPVCRFARKGRLRIMKENLNFMPATGYSAIDKQYFYGFKLNLVLDENGIPFDFAITEGNQHDVSTLKELTDSLTDNTALLGDKGYIQQDVQLELFETRKIEVITPNRKNQKVKTKWNGKYRKKRKRIETMFSQLCDQFNLKKNFAKTTRGFITRIIAKLTGVIVLQLLNKLNDRPINHLKNALCF